MAIPTFTILPPMIKVSRVASKFRIVNKVLVTANAIIVHDLLSRFFNKNYLWLGSQSENRGVSHAIFRLEKVLVEYIIVWHMTVVAVGNALM